MTQASRLLDPGTAKGWLDTLGAEVYYASKDGCLAESRGVMVGLQTAAYNEEAVREIRLAYRLAQAKGARRLASLSVYRFDRIDLRAFADDRVRAGLASLAREAEGLFSATAVVLDSPGFVAAALRSAGSGIMLVARPKTPTRFFDNIADAVRWISPHLSTVRDEQLPAHFDRVLRAMDEACIARRAR